MSCHFYRMTKLVYPPSLEMNETRCLSCVLLSTEYFCVHTNFWWLITRDCRWWIVSRHNHPLTQEHTHTDTQLFNLLPLSSSRSPISCSELQGIWHSLSPQGRPGTRPACFSSSDLSPNQSILMLPVTQTLLGCSLHMPIKRYISQC